MKNIFKHVERKRTEGQDYASKDGDISDFSWKSMKIYSSLTYIEQE
jgi:hypothetical protein